MRSVWPAIFSEQGEKRERISKGMEESPRGEIENCACVRNRDIHQLSPSARRLFYLAVIQPDLEYAATATIPFMSRRKLSTSLRDRLCSVWRRAVRCVAGADWQAEVAPILKNHRLTPIEHRWALQFAVVVRRCVQKSAPLSLCTRLSFTEHSHQTRGSGNSLRPFCPSSRPGMLSFTNRAPLVWNSLPASIKQAQTMNFFKSEYLKQGRRKVFCIGTAK